MSEEATMQEIQQAAATSPAVLSQQRHLTSTEMLTPNNVGDPEAQSSVREDNVRTDVRITRREAALLAALSHYAPDGYDTSSVLDNVAVKHDGTVIYLPPTPTPVPDATPEGAHFSNPQNGGIDNFVQNAQTNQTEGAHFSSGVVRNQMPASRVVQNDQSHEALVAAFIKEKFPEPKEVIIREVS